MHSFRNLLVNFDIKVGLIGLLLGILSGLGFANALQIDIWDEISALGSLLSGVGGIGAVIVATLALQRWKRSYDYPLAVQYCQRLDESMDELMSLLSKVLTEKITRHEDIINSSGSAKLSLEEGNIIHGLKKAIDSECAVYSRTLVSLISVLPADQELAKDLNVLSELEKPKPFFCILNSLTQELNKGEANSEPDIVAVAGNKAMLEKRKFRQKHKEQLIQLRVKISQMYR